jgi:hypothetical protein
MTEMRRLAGVMPLRGKLVASTAKMAATMI